MERRGEARKWKRTNPRLFFNIHSIIIKTKENSSNWFELFLSFFRSNENFFQNLRSDATLGTRFHLSESLERKFLLPLDSSLVVMWKRSTIFSEAIHGEMKKGGGKREKERERERGGSMFHFPYKFNYDKRRETSRARETHKEKHAQG